MAKSLTLSPAQVEKYRAFRECTVPHREQLRAEKDAWRSLSQALIDGTSSKEGPAITLLYGPTGVGKTTMWNHLLGNAELAHHQRALPGTFAWLYVQMDVPAAGNLSMKSFYVRSLDAANNALTVHHQLPGSTGGSGQPTILALEQAVLKMLAHRQPVVLCIDEAQHLGTHSTDAQRDKNLDAIKSFANSTAVPILMLGTYELVEFGHLSGRLGRRVREVHLPRYDMEVLGDAKEFRTVLHNLAQRLPKGSHDLVADRIYLHEETCGCVGLLKGWLERAYYRALFDGRDAVTRADVRETAPMRKVVNQCLAEILQGEARIRGLSKQQAPQAPPSTAQPLHASTRRSAHKKAKKGQKKPGQRNELSDPVGGALVPKAA